MRMRNFIIVLIAVLVVAAIGITASAAPPDAKETGLIGTWSGWADQPWPNQPSAAWLAVVTPGSKDAKNGAIVMNWVGLSANLLSLGYPSIDHLTPGQGVWEQVGKNYKYTWYAYGIDTSGQPVYSVRVSGTLTSTDADTFSLTYAYEIFFGVYSPKDMVGRTPSGVKTGVGGLDRTPMVP